MRDSNGFRALGMAAREGLADVVQALLKDTRCDVNKADDDSATALHYACFMGHREVARVLLESGADHTVMYHGDRTPMRLAQERGHRSCLKLMKVGGAGTALSLY